jgi:hypothetical protein
MLEREQKLGFRSAANPGGLVFAVKFNDGRYFPEVVRVIEHRDFSEWAYTAASFRQSLKFLEFQTEVRSFAEKLAERLENAPPWQDDFRSRPPLRSAATPPRSLGCSGPWTQRR